VQTLDEAIYFGMPELISVSKEHLELDCNISQTMEGSICQVDAEALSAEAKGLNYLFPWYYSSFRVIERSNLQVFASCI
jgi:HD superfamily phosphodiesterase